MLSPVECRCSRIPTSTVCTENKRGKHAQAQHTRMKSTRRQGHGVSKQGKDTRTQRALSTSGFVDAGCVCANMHNKQSQARAGGLSVDHPGHCLGQVGCGSPGVLPWTGWHPPRVSSAVAQLLDHCRVLLCFKPMLGNRYGPWVPSCQQTSDNNLGVA